jgi:hypothetical protein
VSHELDEFRENHPRAKAVESRVGLFSRPVGDTMIQEEPQQSISKDCGWCKGSEVDSVSAPRLLTEIERDLSVPRPKS